MFGLQRSDFITSNFYHMKKFVPESIILTLCLVFCVNVSAQNYSRKYDRVTADELGMNSYPADTTASAVILYKEALVTYDMVKFNIVTDYYVKIKVLKSDGTKYADVQVPYINDFKVKETIANINAIAHNPGSGKPVKTQLKKSMIFTEKLNDRVHVMKFSIPEVKVGTVIEYRYKHTSELVYNIPDMQMQADIPIVYALADLEVPEYFKFDVHTKGYHHISVKESVFNGRAEFGESDPITYGGRKLTCVAENVPALRSDGYIWNTDDYTSMLEFEVSRIAFGNNIKSYSVSWDSVNKRLAESDFGKALKRSGLMPEAVAAAQGIADPEEKMRSILKAVQSRIMWNGRYRLYPDNLKKVIDEGTGTSGDINLVLLNVLNDAGFNAIPILLNPRRYGRLPLTHPSLDNINSVIVMVETGETRYFMDATNKGSDVNVIAPAVMVDRARIYGVSGVPGWVDLTALSPNARRSLMQATIDTDSGVVNVDEQVQYTNVEALRLSSRIENEESAEAYMDKFAADNDMEVSEFNFDNLNSCNVTQKLNYTLPANMSGDMIYLNATLLKLMSRNIMTHQTRELPVEFDYPHTYEIVCRLTLPEGYMVEEVPEKANLSVCDDGLKLVYGVGVAGGVLTARMVLSINRVIFPGTEYQELYEFFGRVAEKCNSQIVLKKAN